MCFAVYASADASLCAHRLACRLFLLLCSWKVVAFFCCFCFGGLCVVMCLKFEGCCLFVVAAQGVGSLNGFCFFVRSSVLVLVFVESGVFGAFVLRIWLGVLAVR